MFQICELCHFIGHANSEDIILQHSLQTHPLLLFPLSHPTTHPTPLPHPITCLSLSSHLTTPLFPLLHPMTCPFPLLHYWATWPLLLTATRLNPPAVLLVQLCCTFPLRRSHTSGTRDCWESSMTLSPPNCWYVRIIVSTITWRLCASTLIVRFFSLLSHYAHYMLDMHCVDLVVCSCAPAAQRWATSHVLLLHLLLLSASRCWLLSNTCLCVHLQIYQLGVRLLGHMLEAWGIM